MKTTYALIRTQVSYKLTGGLNRVDAHLYGVVESAQEAEQILKQHHAAEPKKPPFEDGVAMVWQYEVLGQYDRLVITWTLARVGHDPFIGTGIIHADGRGVY